MGDQVVSRRPFGLAEKGRIEGIAAAAAAAALAAGRLGSHRMSSGVGIAGVISA